MIDCRRKRRRCREPAGRTTHAAHWTRKRIGSDRKHGRMCSLQGLFGPLTQRGRAKRLVAKSACPVLRSATAHSTVFSVICGAGGATTNRAFSSVSARSFEDSPSRIDEPGSFGYNLGLRPSGGMADAAVSKTVVERRASSTLASGTTSCNASTHRAPSRNRRKGTYLKVRKSKPHSM